MATMLAGSIRVADCAAKGGTRVSMPSGAYAGKPACMMGGGDALTYQLIDESATDYLRGLGTIFGNDFKLGAASSGGSMPVVLIVCALVVAYLLFARRGA